MTVMKPQPPLADLFAQVSLAEADAQSVERKVDQQIRAAARRLGVVGKPGRKPKGTPTLANLADQLGADTPKLSHYLNNQPRADGYVDRLEPWQKDRLREVFGVEIEQPPQPSKHHE